MWSQNPYSQNHMQNTDSSSTLIFWEMSYLPSYFQNIHSVAPEMSKFPDFYYWPWTNFEHCISNLTPLLHFESYRATYSLQILQLRIFPFSSNCPSGLSREIPLILQGPTTRAVSTKVLGYLSLLQWFWSPSGAVYVHAYIGQVITHSWIVFYADVHLSQCEFLEHRNNVIYCHFFLSQIFSRLSHIVWTQSFC